eukprot:gene19922-21874_t
MQVFTTSSIGATNEEFPDQDDESVASEEADAKPKEDCYEVVGTMFDNSQKKPDWVKETCESSNRDGLLEMLRQCDVIVYDIISNPSQVDEASWAASALHAELETFTSPKIFICVSTAMTWAKSKPVDEDDPEVPFTEEDYRRRKPHPNFKSHISAEKLIIKLGKTNKSKLLTYVVAAGLTYGAGEDIFHYLFKTAWLGQAPALQCFGNGLNVVPTIHVKDLANVLVNIADQKPRVRYLLAVDDANSTLEEIVQTVSKFLGNDKVKHIHAEDALLEKTIEQADFDMLLVNLRMDATYIKEGMNIPWVSTGGLPATITKVIKEYKQARGLLPMRACVLGPPACGKTTVVRQLCEHYKLHHIKIQDVINEAIENLEKSAARADQDDNDDDDVAAQESQELLDDLLQSKERNGGRYEDQYILKFYKDKLHSMPCQNQGFVLDGFPKTYEQAKELFAVDRDDDDADDEKQVGYDQNTMPEVVICLEASDEFLKNRVMNLPESLVAGTHNTEEGLLRRLADFRAVNTEDETVRNYFDELEIHPELIDITSDSDPNMKETLDKIINIMGKARNYGPTPEELAEMERIEREQKLEQEAREMEEKEEKERIEAQERAKNLEEWREKLNEVKRQEEESLENQSIPLRNYLMKHVMPTLTTGLIECCKHRPDDPIDFLAEYLFENNPQIE